MDKRRISKLVLPVAGFGTRLMPLTKKTPKSLVKLCGRPLLDYILHEAYISGFTEIFLIVRPEEAGVFRHAVRRAKKRFPYLRFRLLAQKESFGTGHAILMAAPYLDKEPFAVRYTDDILIGKIPALTLLLDVFHKRHAPLFTLERVPWNEVHRYGVISIKKALDPRLYEINGVVERPKNEEFGKELKKNFSNLAVVGAYILTPAILEHLKDAMNIAPPLQDVLPITLGFHRELAQGGRVYGFEFPGVRLDCGALSGFRKSEIYLRKRGIGN